jgi:RNA polymerase sigma-70 factor (ECF subfamily)
MQQDFDIQEIKRGDEDAFRRFFDFLYPKLMGLACRFVDDEEAKDLVQDVFVDYWEQKQFLDIANVSSYLYKSIQNKCLNHIKHKAVVENHASKVKIAQERMDYLARNTDESELFSQISDRNLRELIEASVRKLPPKCQEAFRLCYFHGMTCKETAERMELSPRTVEGHVQKAITFLREDMLQIR